MFFLKSTSFLITTDPLTPHKAPAGLTRRRKRCYEDHQGFFKIVMMWELRGLRNTLEGMP